MNTVETIKEPIVSLSQTKFTLPLPVTKQRTEARNGRNLLVDSS
jgi:hypothetical protein